MKKLPLLLAMLFLAAHSVASAEAGKLEPSHGGVIHESNNMVEYWYSPAAQSTHSEAGDSQRIIQTGLSGAPLQSSLLWDLNEQVFLADSVGVSQPARSAPKIETPSLEYAQGRLPSTSGLVNPGLRPLFISGTINRKINSLPESLTMLILGLGLIGLAGYGGRKKFKH